MKRELFSYSIEQVAPYIDWSYLLHAWGIAKGENKEAERIIADARALLQQMNGKYNTRGLFALCKARSYGDDIIIESTTLPLLRQQHCVPGKPNLCLSDFVSPHNDTIGLFATTVESSFGSEYADDDYLNLLAQTLADRLAEATATLMHRDIRRDSTYWGYAPQEQLTPEQLTREEYQGIRPAVGYPSLPDQSVIFIIDKLLKLEEAGITLTANGAMQPHASVCGIMISHPAAHYFAVGNIDTAQLNDYAERRALPAEEIRKFLARNIG